MVRNQGQNQLSSYRRKRERLRRRRRLVVMSLLGLLLAALLVAGVLALARRSGDRPQSVPTAVPGKDTGTPKATKTPTVTMSPTPSPSPSPSPTPTPSVKKASLVAVGDNLFDWYMLEDGYLGNGTFSFEGCYDHIKPYLELADFAVVNQETPFGGDGGYRGSGVEYDYIKDNQRWGSYHGYSTFNTPDEVGDALYEAGFRIFTMATNHASDYGYKALERSIRYFDKYEDVTVLGIHDSKEDQERIRVVSANGVRLALLNYTYGVNLGTATSEAPYSIDLLDRSRVKRDVAAAKELADFVVVFVHWGTEYKMEANSYQKDYTALFLECKVDAVVGAHPHISQPMEWKTSDDGHRMVVYYSLGNFLSMFKNAKCQLEGMAYLEFCIDGDDKYISEGTIIPLVNHWTYDASVFGKRKDFTVYALQDYSEALAGQHGCINYSEGASFSYALMQQLATALWDGHIKLVE